MIFSVCIQIFVVSSMFLERIINISSLKERWNMNDSEINTSKTIKINKVSIETINVPNMSLKKIINESSLKEQWNMKDSEVNTSKTIKIKKVSIEIINVSNMSLRRIINESSFKQQGNINVPEISTKKVSLMFAPKSAKCYQRFFLGSSTISQWSNKATSAFWWLSHYKLQWSLPFASKSL